MKWIFGIFYGNETFDILTFPYSLPLSPLTCQIMCCFGRSEVTYVVTYLFLCLFSNIIRKNNALVFNLDPTYNCAYTFSIFISLDIQCKIRNLSHIGTTNECDWGNFFKQVLTKKSAQWLVHCLILIFLGARHVGSFFKCVLIFHSSQELRK